MRKNSIKNTRINAEVQKELANLIRSEIKDPRIAPMTCVTDVEVAPDLKTCKVWISTLGDDEAREATLKGLKNAEVSCAMSLLPISICAIRPSLSSMRILR